MVIKTCKICGKEFEGHGLAKYCSEECRKINKKKLSKEWRENNPEYQKEYRKSDKGKAAMKRYRESDKGKEYVKEYKKEYRENHRDEIREYQKEYRENHRDEIREYQKEYRKSDKGKEYRKKWCKNNPEYYKEYQQSDKQKEYRKEYYEKNRDRIHEYQKEYQKEYTRNKIAELNERFDGDLDLILKDCPNTWLVREAIMQVEYGVSYAEAMYQKEQINPVCEITGESGDLVNHHLDSFNTHPEKGADLDNIVRVKSEIHDEFHSIYGYGNNTREQWFEFLEKNRNIYI